MALGISFLVLFILWVVLGAISHAPGQTGQQSWTNQAVFVILVVLVGLLGWAVYVSKLG